MGSLAAMENVSCGSADPSVAGESAIADVHIDLTNLWKWLNELATIRGMVVQVSTTLVSESSCATSTCDQKGEERKSLK